MSSENFYQPWKHWERELLVCQISCAIWWGFIFVQIVRSWM